MYHLQLVEPGLELCGYIASTGFQLRVCFLLFLRIYFFYSLEEVDILEVVGTKGRTL